MTKEKLTIGTIRQELKKEKKEFRTLFWLFLSVLLALALIAVGLWKLTKLWIVSVICLGGFVFLLLLGLVILIIDMVKLRKVSKRRVCVVKDTLIGMEEKDDLGGRNRIRKIYHLHFSGYGEYVITDLSEHYTWSAVLGPMSGKGVYLTSHCGDTFYLVLSRPHDGEILFVYNANLFEFEE